MIDFRYHLVSLVSVFLALALGIVVGTTGLNGALLDDLRDQVNGLKDDKEALRDTNVQLTEQLSKSNEYLTKMAPAIVGNKLDGDRVLLVSTPGTDEAVVDGVRTMIEEQAGGTISGEVKLLDDYVNGERADDLRSYATNNIPAGFTLPEKAETGELFGELMGILLMRDPDAEKGPPDSTVRLQALAGITQLNVMEELDDDIKPSNYAIVVDTQPEIAENGNVDPAIEMITGLVEGLQDRSEAAVLAGTVPTAGKDGAIHAIRESPGMYGKLTTVDNVDSAAGKISTILALPERANGHVGQYGIGPEAADPSPPYSS